MSDQKLLEAVRQLFDRVEDAEMNGLIDSRRVDELFEQLDSLESFLTKWN